MPDTLEGKLVVAISSRALFDLEESHSIFVEEGVDAYARFQIERETVELEPGVAYHLVEKLLGLGDRVEVILLSRNSADTGLRVFNSIASAGLGISRAVFTGGRPPYPYVRPFGAHLFLSAEGEDVRAALDAGCAAATILPRRSAARAQERFGDRLRIAFDGDAVLFSDEAEQIYQREGIAAFSARERAAAREPLDGGPFKGFLAALHRLLAAYPAEDAPVRTALVTSRSAPAHERVIRTLRAWGIRIDEALFLGGLDKAAFLETFGADIFFDDQRSHCDAAAQVVATGHVPHGVANLR